MKCLLFASCLAILGLFADCFCTDCTAQGTGADRNGAQVPHCRPVVAEVLPHDPKAYTQGLFFWKGILYESTGLNGKSSLRQVELKSGKVLKTSPLERRYFGEGSAVADGRLYVLTWTSATAFIYDPVSLTRLQTLSYPREGWGLASLPPSGRISHTENLPQGAVLVASDGSSSLYYLNSSLKTLKTLNVTLKGRPLRYLNELEWVDGRIWANVYTTDKIVIINPVTGVVECIVDCSELIPAKDRTEDMDVLNGIAADGMGNVYLTGKNWPKMFRITL